MKNIVIIGGGTGGTVVANRLANRLYDQKDISITLFAPEKNHIYQPDLLFLSLDLSDPRRMFRDEQKLLNKKVNLIQQPVDAINVDNKFVISKGKKYAYDYLVIATGARLVPDLIPGLAGNNNHFYDYSSAMQLRDKLRGFKKGVIVTGVADVPYKCPPAPLEFTLLLDYKLRKSGLRSSVDLTYIYPINSIFTIQNVVPILQKEYDTRNIAYKTFFIVDHVDPEKHEVVAMDGETVKYDLLVLIPPHRGQQIISDAGIGDEGGWMSVDKYTLQEKNHEEIYGIGDATNLPVSKAGSVAHFQSGVIANNISNSVLGIDEKINYDGSTMCMTEIGYDKGLILLFDYSHPPYGLIPSRLNHLAKVFYLDYYFANMMYGLP